MLCLLFKPEDWIDKFLSKVGISPNYKPEDRPLYNHNRENLKSNSLRHYATSRKVAGSSPDEVDFFFQLT
jgi:hypothetical protein